MELLPSLKIACQNREDLLLPSMLLNLFQLDHFYLVSSWVVPSKPCGMDFNQFIPNWKCMIMPSDMTMDDLCKLSQNL
jgi:hypothetical protein